MPTLDASQIGRVFGPFPKTYGFREVSLYALASGAGPDELPLIIETQGEPKVLPAFAVTLQTDAFHAAMVALNGNLLMRLHGAQRFEILAPLPMEGTVETTAWTRAIYDQGKGAIVVLEGETRDATGRLLVRATMEIFYRAHGGFGGEKREDPPAFAPTEPAAHVVEDQTLGIQAQLYRLASGDLNEIHSDPAVARRVAMPRPILHGMCTFAFATRAVTRALCGGDPDRITAIGARFTKPVFPGERLTTAIYPSGEGEVRFVTRSSSRGDVVLEGDARVSARAPA